MASTIRDILKLAHDILLDSLNTISPPPPGGPPTLYPLEDFLLTHMAVEERQFAFYLGDVTVQALCTCADHINHCTGFFPPRADLH